MCAFALHLAFPRADLPWLAPLALGGLFALWMSLPLRAAAWTGYLSGVVFFALDFTWFGETAGSLIGPFAFILDLGPALIEATAFALAAALASLAAQRLHGGRRLVAVAGAFTTAEWLRSIGVLGAPMYTLGSPFAETPLRAIAAYGGGPALTFAVALAAAAVGDLLLERTRAAALRCGATVAAIALAAAAAWGAWPARVVPPATIRVAAVQGNIKQDLKWSAPALSLAVDRYTALTQSIAAFKPQFVLWPETVITTRLTGEPALEGRFGALARQLHATLAVGSIEAPSADEYYNSLFFFGPDGTPTATYRKRQLVPFIERLPGPAWLRALPGGNLPSNFGFGSSAAVIDPQLRIAPLICWESAFGDLAQLQVASGARIFAIATDDAWFGTSDGPYWHAQVASLRAVETGRWIVRAAATGISGIIAPDGTWRARSALDTQTVVTGTVGEPQPTVYGRIGPAPVELAVVALTLIAFFTARRRSA
ncbi:MAG: apolipoprotein N-acyltransferase [Candidatus Velthaea sp.]